jgi:hypothetical protein
MGTLAYNPERLVALDALLERVHSDLAAVRCGDIEASSAIAAVRSAAVSVGTVWAPLVNRILAARALEDPLSLDPDDVRNTLWLDLQANGWVLAEDPVDSASSSIMIDDASVTAFARFANNDHTLAKIDTPDEQEWFAAMLAAVEADPAARAVFLATFDNWGDSIDALAVQRVEASSGLFGWLTGDDEVATVDGAIATLGLLYRHAEDRPPATQLLSSMSPLGGALLLPHLDLTASAAGGVANDLFLRARSSGDGEHPELYDDDRVGAVVFAILAVEPAALDAYLHAARREGTLLDNAQPDLDGRSATFRDTYNRAMLDVELDELTRIGARRDLTAQEQQRLANLKAIDKELDEFDAAIDPITGEPVGGQLYIYEPYAFDGDGRAAVAIGNIDTADHIALMVPGMGAAVAGLGAGRPINVYREARAASDDGGSVAVIDWIGYDAPSGTVMEMATEVVNRDAAEAGARLLDDDVDGLRRLRGDSVHITVIGNSYGSTTAAIAADHFGLDADDLILTGSPGAGDANSAADLTTGRDHTWVGSASTDVVTYLGDNGITDMTGELSEVLNVVRHIPIGAPPIVLDPLLPDIEVMGVDPALDTFSAQRFEAESTTRTNGIHWDDHGKYYDRDSESLANVGAVVAGEYDEVTHAEHRDGMPLDIFDVDDFYIDDPENSRRPTTTTHID